MRNPAEELLKDTAAYIRRVAYEEARREGKSEDEANKAAESAEAEFWKRNK